MLNDVFLRCVFLLHNHRLRRRLRQAQRRELLVAHASGCHFFDGKAFHPGCENTRKHSRLESKMWLWLHGFGVLCVDVKCAKIWCFETFLVTKSIFHPKGAPNRHGCFYVGPPFSILRILGKKQYFIHRKCPKHTESRLPKTQKRPKPAGHPVQSPPTPPLPTLENYSRGHTGELITVRVQVPR